MKISDIRNTLMPKIKTFCGVPIIGADQIGEKPDGPHATYKFTNAYGKDIGRAAEFSDGSTMIRQESFKTTISFSAYDLDEDVSRDLAQQIHDWFSFYGADDLHAANIAVVDLTNIVNRDAFVVENYERRNGFDVIIRVGRELERLGEIIESVETAQTNK